VEGGLTFLSQMLLDGLSFLVLGPHGSLEGLGLVPSGLEFDFPLESNGSFILGVEIVVGSNCTLTSEFDVTGNESCSGCFGFCHFFGALEEGESIEGGTGGDGSSEDSGNDEFHVR